MRSVKVLSDHMRAWLAHQSPFGAKIARLNTSQFYVIKIYHWVQMIIDVAAFTPKWLFFVI